jgi:hypothetical protein
MASCSVVAQQTVLLCIKQRAAAGPHAGHRSMQLFAGQEQRRRGISARCALREDFCELTKMGSEDTKLLERVFFLFCQKIKDEKAGWQTIGYVLTN